MKIRTRSFQNLAMLSAFVLTSCATTTLKTVWKDDSYEGRLKRILVVGVSKRPAVRRFFEDEFARHLRALGTDAISGYTVLPLPGQMLDKDAIAPKINELEVDGVLVSRLVDRKKLETYYPPERVYVVPRGYYRGWHRYYVDSYEYVRTPGYMVEREIVVLETNLYEAKSERLIWSALSETFIEGTSDEVMRSFIKAIVKDLSNKKLL